MNRPLSMELLAPAGGREQLHAALRFGADAVYLGVDRFSMRARAANFKIDDVPAAVDCAHRFGAKVYVTCNVLMKPEDMRELPAYFEALDQAGVDAFIIGDLGAMRVARQVAPRVALHVSTQASITNAEAALAWYELGARRIVCARELSLQAIAELRSAIPEDLELEAFVHGSMCMAVSGRCLISSYLTGRSANQGHCTQPCRWKYTLEEEKRPGQHFPIEEDEQGTFIMNAKDMNLIDHLDEIADAGVQSIKIEGRNKKAFYVATVVNAYRRVLDGEDPELLHGELNAVSHRPFSTGFYFGTPDQATDFDGYEQETMHVADVVACIPRRDFLTQWFKVRSFKGDRQKLEAYSELLANTPHTDGYLVLTRCRNRYEEGQELEVLTPGRPTQKLVVKNLIWYPEPKKDDPHPRFEKVEVANRSCAIYGLRSDEPIPPGSFLRVRSYRRSARHGEA